METIDVLLARPLALFVVLAIGAAIGMGVERIVNRLNAAKRKAYWRGRNDAKGKVIPIAHADHNAGRAAGAGGEVGACRHGKLDKPSPKIAATMT